MRKLGFNRVRELNQGPLVANKRVSSHWTPRPMTSKWVLIPCPSPDSVSSYRKRSWTKSSGLLRGPAADACASGLLPRLSSQMSTSRPELWKASPRPSSSSLAPLNLSPSPCKGYLEVLLYFLLGEIIVDFSSKKDFLVQGEELKQSTG